MIKARRRDALHKTDRESSFPVRLALSTQVFSWAPRFLCSPCEGSVPGDDVGEPSSPLLLSTHNNSTPDAGGLVVGLFPILGCSVTKVPTWWLPPALCRPPARWEGSGTRWGQGSLGGASSSFPSSLGRGWIAHVLCLSRPSLCWQWLIPGLGRGLCRKS